MEIKMSHRDAEVTKHNFFNSGYIKTKLPNKLYKSLLKECLNEEKKEEKITGITSKGVPKHYYIQNNYENLVIFIAKIQKIYEETFPEVSDIKVLTNNVPYVYDRPWVNFQKENQFMPFHSHDGIFSYVIWLKIPYDSSKEKYSGNFNFLYTDILGSIKYEIINLSKKDEGTILMFPAKLNHTVWPFYNNKNIRMSVSGNILLSGGNDKIIGEIQ
jgi:hypothetical protein